MKAYRLANGNLLVPARAELADGTHGDGMMQVDQDNPLYAVWAPWAVDEPPPEEEP